MPTAHDDFLDAHLLRAFPGQVSLVGRYEDANLGFASGGPLRVFLPDFHWMSKACLARFTGGYNFNGTTLLGDQVFRSLLDTISAFAATTRVEVFQLGDRYDLWREMTAQDQGDALAAYARIREDPLIKELASRLDVFGTTYIRGNHDAWLATIAVPDPGRPDATSSDGKIFLTHGHRYDTIEGILPDDVKAALVGLAPKVKPSKHAVGLFQKKNVDRIKSFLKLIAKLPPHQSLYPTVQPDGALPIARSTDITDLGDQWVTYLDVSNFSRGAGDMNDFEHISYLTFADQISRFEESHPNDHAMHVIGHTHHARLLVDRLQSGRPLVIMDTGGWIEDCTIHDKGGATHRAPSRQIGVQSENDVRLYQIGGVAAL